MKNFQCKNCHQVVSAADEKWLMETCPKCGLSSDVWEKGRSTEEAIAEATEEFKEKTRKKTTECLSKASADWTEAQLKFLAVFVLHFESLEIQRKRIEENKERGDIWYSYVDISSYLTILNKIRLIFIRFEKFEPPKEEFMKIYTNYKKSLEEACVLRHHFEHIDYNRIEGKDFQGNPFPDPLLPIFMDGDKLIFYGVEFDLANIYTAADALKKEIYDWLEVSFPDQALIKNI